MDYKNLDRYLTSEGGDRITYYIGDNKVLKVGKSIDGEIENDNEDYIYNNCPENLKHLLCPVLEYDEKAKRLIMVEANTFDRDWQMIREWQNFIIENKKDISALINMFDLDDFDILDCSFNWGILNGKFVIIDYGRTDFDEPLEGFYCA